VPDGALGPDPFPAPMAAPERAALHQDGHELDPPPSIWIDADEWIESDIPRRAWVAPGYALRGAVTIVAGAPSVMKSSLMIAWAIAVALGRPYGDFRPATAGIAALYNVEDDAIEQRRRLSAALRQFNAAPSDIAGCVVRITPAATGALFVVDRAAGRILPTPAMTQLRAAIAARQPDVLIADPLSELHGCDENDNTALRGVIAEFRALAIAHNLAVVLIHHVRKGGVTPGDPDGARGASSIIGAARIVYTLVGMTEDEAAAFGMPTDQLSRSRYIRLDSAKQNYAGHGEPKWLEKALYLLENGETIAAAVPWAPPNMWRDIPSSVANRILDDIDAGIDGRKRLYSAAPNATGRGAWNVVLRYIPSLTEPQARKIIATWRRNGVLQEEEYTDPAEGKRRGCIVNDAKRPTGAST